MPPGAQHHASVVCVAMGTRGPLPPLLWNHTSVRVEEGCASLASSPRPGCHPASRGPFTRTAREPRGPERPQGAPSVGFTQGAGLRPPPSNQALLGLALCAAAPHLGGEGGRLASAPSKPQPPLPALCHPVLGEQTVAVSVSVSRRNGGGQGAGRACCLTSCTLTYAPDPLARSYRAPTRYPAL